MKFATSGSIISMSAGGLLLCPLWCTPFGTAPGKDFSVQRVPARSVVGSKLSGLDIGQVSCLSSPTDAALSLLPSHVEGLQTVSVFGSSDCSVQIY